MNRTGMHLSVFSRALTRCGGAVGLLLMLLLIGIGNTPLEGQARRGAAPGVGRGRGPVRGVPPRGAPGFGRAWAWGLGWGSGWAWWYPYGIYRGPVVNDYVIWPPSYEIPQSSVPLVVLPPPSTNTITGPIAKLVYDANGKPFGVVLQNADGSQEFVPVSP